MSLIIKKIAVKTDTIILVKTSIETSKKSSKNIKIHDTY